MSFVSEKRRIEEESLALLAWFVGSWTHGLTADLPEQAILFHEEVGSALNFGLSSALNFLPT